jgi:methyl-accepting chemotaxis protein
MKLTIGTKIYSGYLLAIAVIVFFGMTAYMNTEKLLTESKMVTQRNVVKNLISSFSSALKDAETGQRGYIITGDDNFLEVYFQGKDSVSLKFRQLQELTVNNAKQVKQTEKLKPLIDTRIARLEEIIQLRKNKGFEAVGNSVIMGVGKQVMDEIRVILNDMTIEEESLLIGQTASMNATSKRTNLSIALGLPLAAVLLALIGFFITRDISNPLKKVTQTAEQIADGDLSMNLTYSKRSDELGIMMLSFNKMIKMLREQNLEILKGVNVIASTSSQILTSTTQIGTGSAETAAAISETTTTVEEVRQAAQLSSQKDKNLSDSATRVAQVSLDGKKAVDETGTEMNNISKQMDEIAKTVILLSEHSQSIGGIIASVTDMASQSNLLAVNAAIEAAKAGEQGKGFSVVAQEIRNLAEQSRQATLQVRKILNDVQKATSAAVLATEQGNRAVNEGVKKSVLAGEAIRSLSETTGAAFQVSTQIVASSQQQLIGMDQIGLAMQNINQAGLDTAVSMTQAEEALKNLHDLGQKLKELVEQFKM